MLLKKGIIPLLAASFIATTAAVNDTNTANMAVNYETLVVTKQAERKQIFLPAIVPAKVTVQAVRVNFVVNKNKNVPEENVTTTTVAEIPEGLKCPEYYLLAKEVGWPEDQLERLDYVMWRESRCIPSVHNKNDPNSGSRGLIQINGYWCRKNSYTNHPAGYLGLNGVLESCEELFDPETNLIAGLEIYNYGIERHKCGWGPWSTKKSTWCRR